jgi:hypothetical protein
MNGSRETLGAMGILTCIASAGVVVREVSSPWASTVLILLLASLASFALAWAFLTPRLQVLRQTHRFEWVCGLSAVAVVFAIVFAITGVWEPTMMALVAVQAGVAGICWLDSAEDHVWSRRLS